MKRTMIHLMGVSVCSTDSLAVLAEQIETARAIPLVHGDEDGITGNNSPPLIPTTFEFDEGALLAPGKFNPSSIVVMWEVEVDRD